MGAVIVSIFIIGICFAAQTLGDSRCTAIGGNCQYDWSSSSCPGGVRRGLCSGPSSRRCCLPAASTDDSRCTAIGGNCQYDLSPSSCPGGDRSGLCSGPSSRRCCLPAASTGGPCFSSSEMTALENKLIEYEDIRYTAYDAQPNNPSYVDLTICVGFNLKREEAPAVFGSVLPGVNFVAVYNREASLTRSQCIALFRYDLSQTYIPRAKRVAGTHFCNFPENVKIAVVNAVYRGDLAYNHRTAGYIRVCNWCAVPDEYLDNNQYRNCRVLGIPGVCTRMDWNAAQFRTMC